MGETRPIGPRDDLLQIALDPDGVLLASEPQPLREATNVRVDHDALRVPEISGDDVRRLASDARKPHQLVEPRRDLPVELLEQDVPGAADRLRFLPEKAGGLDVPLELLLWTGAIAKRNAWALYAAVYSHGHGVASLPVAFVQWRGVGPWVAAGAGVLVIHVGTLVTHRVWTNRDDA